jgi:hypothetical protein
MASNFILRLYDDKIGFRILSDARAKFLIFKMAAMARSIIAKPQQISLSRFASLGSKPRAYVYLT